MKIGLDSKERELGELRSQLDSRNQFKKDDSGELKRLKESLEKVKGELARKEGKER